MKNSISLSIYALCMSAALCGCGQAQSGGTVRNQGMDPVTYIPEWLKVTVESALPSDSLNVWLPTGELATSSLIRVPRFPAPKHENDKQPSPFDILPVDFSAIHSITGVRNEQQSFQLSVAAVHELTGLSVKVEDLISEKGDTLDAGCVKVRYVRYVPVERARSEYTWTARQEDVYGQEVSGTGVPDVVADPLMELSAVDVPAYRAQPVWFTVEIPESAVPDIYRGKLVIHTDQYQEVALNLAVNVLAPTLPAPENYSFFLDLWFNPNAVAVEKGVEAWSEEHWKLIDPYLADLASRGAKTITTTIVPYPWKVDWLAGSQRPQTYMGYPAMITWLLDGSGKWSFDYTVFDRFVEACFKHGIDRRIDAFSLSPFNHKTDRREIVYRHKETNASDTLYYDQFAPEYKEVWKAFLRDFETHLASKDWLSKTYLSFDESPHEVIESILDIVGDSAPVFLQQFSIAGRKEASSLAKSFSLFYSFLPEELAAGDEISTWLQERKKDPGKITNFYLCGDPAHPNTLTYSPAIEARMIPWLAAHYGLDGYLRWAYNSWSDKDPYNKPVFNFIQGDDYYIYPGENGPVSSIRWELLKEGIEDFELLKIVDSKQKKEAIDMAVRNRDGRKKSVKDFENARKLLIQQ